jgi:hypothetical protein
MIHDVQCPTMCATHCNDIDASQCTLHSHVRSHRHIYIYIYIYLLWVMIVVFFPLSRRGAYECHRSWPSMSTRHVLFRIKAMLARVMILSVMYMVITCIP